MKLDMNEVVARINALARKQKSEGLTEAEKAEQQQLRQHYLAAIRRSMKAELDRIEFVDEPDNPSGPRMLH